VFAAVSDGAKPGESDISGEATGTVKAPRKARSGTGSIRELVATVARIEQRQMVHDQVALCVIDTLAIHDEKLDAILEAATREPGPSPLLGVLAEILKSLREQESLLAALPETLAETIRDEWRGELDADDPEMEPAQGQFDNRTDERD
jgi:hypothetical protein